jgi:hypothetical protein
MNVDLRICISHEEIVLFSGTKELKNKSPSNWWPIKIGIDESRSVLFIAAERLTVYRTPNEIVIQPQRGDLWFG